MAAGERFKGWIFGVGRVLHSAQWLIYVIVLVLGIVASQFVFKPTRIEGYLKQLQNGGSISLTQQSDWLGTLSFLVTTTLVTVSVFELLKLALERFRFYVATRLAFNEFWGIGRSTGGNQGVILLQEENIEDAVTKLAQTEHVFGKPQIDRAANRFFKAINWVNKWDAEAAKHIRAAFWRQGFRPPEVQHIKSTESYTAAPDTFVVSVGLFSEETKRFVRAYSDGKELIDITQTERGDAIELFHSLTSDSDYLEYSKDSDKGMRQVTPKGWNRNKWIHNEPTMDFAIILRHTVRQHSTKLVRFVVAGFTEQGTEAAGKYLSKEWRNLHRTFWAERSSDRRGDFFVVIVGKSNETDCWTQDPAIIPITPPRMEKIQHRVTETLT